MRYEEKRSKRIYNLCMNIITWVFAVCGMALVAVGVMEYKNIATTTVETYKLRTSLSYVATKVRQNDTANGVELKELNGTKTLLLYETAEGKTYETAIYWYDGILREYYHEKGSEFEPRNGFEVLAVEGFDFERSTDGMLRITATDIGGRKESMYINVDSTER